ncbi:MAG: ABC transporter ATP-binding protein, partial [Clostridia bacterium]|nr:ABC transporter ATP-binding protein [Clostridia bacterium]
QDNFLFSDTIENNIAFSQDEADHDLVAEAAEASDVHGDITAFPDGYKTVLGERGVTVSGGQKQRISIARALLKNAPILVMDDSVSAVDTGTERKILESLRTGRKGKTTILIAHRVSTVKDMDKIMMIEDGTVIGFGTHEELYETCREYRKTVELQRLEDEEGGDDNA